MHAEPQKQAGEGDAAREDGPEKRHDENAQKALGGAARADGGYHGVEKPDGCEGAGAGWGHCGSVVALSSSRLASFLFAFRFLLLLLLSRKISPHNQHPLNQPPRHQIRRRKQNLSRAEPCRVDHLGRQGTPLRACCPCGGKQKPGQDGRVPVRLAGVGRLAAGHEAGRVGEDEVVDVSVFDWRVCVLPKTVEEEDGTEEEGGEVKGKWAGE